MTSRRSNISFFLAIFGLTSPSIIVWCYYFCCSASLFPVSISLLSCRFCIFGVRMAWSTQTHLGELAGGVAHSSFTVDRRGPYPYPVLQYIEHYGARLYGRQFAALHLVADAKGILNVQNGRMCNTSVSAWINQWCHWDGPSVTNSRCH